MTTTKSATQEDTMKKPATEPTFDVRFTAQAKHVRRILDAAKAARKAAEECDFDMYNAILGALTAAARFNGKGLNMDGTIEHEAEYLRDLVRWAARHDL
jgi:hypothetical protein